MADLLARLGRLSAADVRAILTEMASRSSQKAVAVKVGCSPAFLNDVVKGRREPSGKLLDALGLERVTFYRAKSNT